MNCPYCETNLEDEIDYENKQDHEMVCTECLEVIDVVHNSYIEEHDESEAHIFELNKKGQ